ncbi:MAG: hypothetical protein ACK53Y_16095, partial [bacterium]
MYAVRTPTYNHTYDLQHKAELSVVLDNVLIDRNTLRQYTVALSTALSLARCNDDISRFHHWWFYWHRFAHVL